jgi:hypothetical protein
VSEIIVRTLHSDDARSASSLIDARFAGTRYRDRMHELLESALRFEDDEHLGLVGADDGAAGVCALALHGAIAGAHGVMRLHALVGDGSSSDAAVLRALLTASAHERMLVCELPDDAPFEHVARALTRSGFIEEGRVDDLVADGVSMRLLVRRVHPAGDDAC